MLRNRVFHGLNSPVRGAFLILLSSRVVGSLVNALTFAWYARLAGVSHVGLVGIFISLTSFIAIVADSGLSSLLSKVRARGDDYVTAGALRLNGFVCSSLGLTISLTIAGWCLKTGNEVWLALIAITSAFEMSTETCLSVPIADGARRVPAISILLRRFSAAAIFGGLIATRLDPTAAYCVATCTGSLGGQVHVRQWIKAHAKLGASRIKLYEVFKLSWPYLVSNISGAVRLLDVTIVGILTSQYSAGLYATASRLVSPFQLISNSVTAIIMPHAARRDRSHARTLALRLAALFGLVSLLLALAAPVIPWVITQVLGEEFKAAAPVLQVLAIGFPLVILTSPLGAILQSQDHQRYVAVNGLIFAAVVVVFIAVGAILDSAVGSALGLTIAYGAKSVSLLWAVEHHLSRPLVRINAWDEASRQSNEV